MPHETCPECPTLIRMKCAGSDNPICTDPNLHKLPAREVIDILVSENPTDKANMELFFEISIRQFTYGKTEEAAEGLQALQEDFGMSTEEIVEASKKLKEEDLYR